MIRAIRRASKFTVYEVINWHLYQDSTVNEGQQEGHVDGQQKGQQRASKGPHLKNIKNKDFSSDSDEFRLAEMLFELIRQRNPEHKAPNLQTWAKHIDLMIRVDGRTPERIEQIMRWALRDSFWSKNILSTEKLRKQFDTLVVKMGGPAKPTREISHLAAV
jgi:hypothetical protein